MCLTNAVEEEESILHRAYNDSAEVKCTLSFGGQRGARQGQESEVETLQC
jgi:hypothetical protein